MLERNDGNINETLKRNTMSKANTLESETLALLSPEVISESKRHLSKADPVMAKLVTSYRPLQEDDLGFPPFHVLVSSIKNQLRTTGVSP